MPRYGIGTYLNKKEHENLVKAVGLAKAKSKYQLVRDAVNVYCAAIISESKNFEQKSRKLGKENRGNSRNQSEESISGKPPFVN